jgi:flagellar protein FliS
MQSSVPDSYLETEVLTATPQKRQLMLIEGAIRFIERTRHHWRAEQSEDACECLIRAQKIVTELLAGLNHEVDPKLSKKVAALYVFVFRALVDASSHRDEAKLDEALRVLEPQREAWQGVCNELGATLPPENEAASASFRAQELFPPTATGPEPLPDSESPDEASAGFSMEA